GGLTPPYAYGGEFVSQFVFVLTLCWFPLLVSTVCFCYGSVGLQAADFLTIFGALDRLGGIFVLGAIREIGPTVTAIVIAGVAGAPVAPGPRGGEGGGGGGAPRVGGGGPGEKPRGGRVLSPVGGEGGLVVLARLV